jgi:acyl-CoA synthetase (AMP-forming)/AMP-acid ligase II
MKTTRPDVLDVLDRPPRSVVALEDRWCSVDYTSLASAVRSVAALLDEHGVRPGDRVVVSLPNSIASVEAFLGCAALGAIWVGINHAAPAKEKSRQCEIVSPRVVIGGTDAYVPTEAELIAVGDNGLLPPSDSRHPLLPRPDLDVPCAIAFSSGTTGTPKAVVPATVYDLVHDDGIGPESLSTLREAGTGAAGLAEGLRVAFEAKFGIRMSGSYGLSEAPAAVCSEDTGRPRRLGSSGVPLPHVSISIRDPAGMPLPTANWGRFGWDRRVLARGRVSIEVLLAAGGMASWFGRRPTGPASLPVTSAASTTKEHCTSSVGRAT